MPGLIDANHIHADELPGIWSPVQWELSEEERTQELEAQAAASLLWAVDAPEAILRLLLDETTIERVYAPPDGYDPELQGEWNESLVTFAFKRPIKLERIERNADSVSVLYKLDGAGYWLMEFTPERVVIERV